MRKNNDSLPHFVYRILNLITDQSYIGITLAHRFPERMNEHITGSGDSKNSYIHRALNLYGPENFSFQIVFEAENKSIAGEEEIFYIDQYKSFENGYNLTKGGNLPPLCKPAVIKAPLNRKTKQPNTSIYIGVSKGKESDWYCNYGEIYIGRFSTEIDAYNAREKFIALYNGDNRRFATRQVRLKRKNGLEFTGLKPSWDKKDWVAFCFIDKKYYHLGTFVNPKDASDYRTRFIELFNGSNLEDCITLLDLEFGKEPGKLFKGK